MSVCPSDRLCVSVKHKGSSSDLLETVYRSWHDKLAIYVMFERNILRNTTCCMAYLRFMYTFSACACSIDPLQLWWEYYLEHRQFNGYLHVCVCVRAYMCVRLSFGRYLSQIWWEHTTSHNKWHELHHYRYTPHGCMHEIITHVRTCTHCSMGILPTWWEHSTYLNINNYRHSFL
jgi:hypothetical protein